MKSSTYYFHMKTKILTDFEICITVPLKHRFQSSSRLELIYRDCENFDGLTYKKTYWETKSLNKRT